MTFETVTDPPVTVSTKKSATPTTAQTTASAVPSAEAR